MYAIQVITPEGKKEGVFWLSYAEVVEALQVINPSYTVWLWKLCDPPYSPEYFKMVRRRRRELSE